MRRFLHNVTASELSPWPLCLHIKAKSLKKVSLTCAVRSLRLTWHTWRDEEAEEHEPEQHLRYRCVCLCSPPEPALSAVKPGTLLCVCVFVCGFYCLFYRSTWSQRFHPHHHHRHWKHLINAVSLCVQDIPRPCYGFTDTCPLFIYCQSQAQCGLLSWSCR